MGSIRTWMLAAAMTAGTCADAVAQDVVVFRRTIADPNRAVPTPPPTPTTTYRWDRGNWSAWSSLCSASATRTRRVDCMANGVVTADQQACVDATGQTAQAEETREVTSDCEYTPTYTPWGTCVARPLGGGSQSRDLTACTRSDGKDVAASYCKDTVLEQSCAPQSPDELVANGQFEVDTAGWSLDGTATRDCGTGGSGCYVTTRSAGSTLTYTTPHPAMDGVSYKLTFAYGNLSTTGNFANTAWKVEAGGQTLISGTISSSGRIGSIHSFGTFTGTGAPVTLTITRTRADSQVIAYDKVSIFRQ